MPLRPVAVTACEIGSHARAKPKSQQRPYLGVSRRKFGERAQRVKRFADQPGGRKASHLQDYNQTK